MRPSKITSGATGITLTLEEYEKLKLLTNGMILLGNESSTLITNQNGLVIQL
jgi:hypothetical protein